MNRYSPSFRKSLILVLLCASFFQNAFAQTTIGRQKVDQYPITPWGTPTYGLTWLPAEYNSTTKKYPLIIFLHGRGETGDGVGGLYNLVSTALPQKIANGWDPQAVNPADGQNYQFIVVSPQAPSASAWSYQYGHVQFILKDVMSRYRIDPDRVYVTGLSAGGAGTWSCVTNGPEGAQKFAAIVPVASAGLNYGTEMDSLKYAGSRYGVKVWQVCGADDAWYSFTKTSTDLYNSGTPTPSTLATETGLPGIGHTAAAWNTAYEHTWRNNVHNKNIFEWMLQYKRTGNISTFNQAPAVNAGADQTITLPANSVQLNGSASDPDGSIASYSWTKISGPAAVLNTGILNPLVTGLVSGTYVFRLTATDNVGEKSSDDITINVNTAPIGSGASSARVEAENWIAMKGVGTEGTSDAGGGLSVGWIDNTDWMDYSVNLSQAGTYTVSFRVATPATSGQLKLLNAAGATLATVNVPNTGWWQTWQTATATVTLPAGQQTLRVLSSSADAWNFNWFELKQGGSTVTNQPPSVTAGPNVTVVLPNSTAELTASAVDPDGSITAISWTKVAGPAQGTLANPTAPVTSVSNLVQGTYTFRVTVVDDAGATATAEEIVIVDATTPTTGPTQRIEAESWTAMKGVGTENTSDAGGGVNVGWIDNTDWMDYSVNLSQAGTYTVNFRVATPATSAQLKLLNAAGTTLATVNVPNTGWWQTWQTVTATVTLPAGQQTLRVFSSSADAWNFNWFELAAGSGGGTPTNQLPTVNAGVDQAITLPASSVQLGGSATDPDGTIATYAWSKVSGPAQGSFNSTTGTNPTFSGLVQGTYTLRLTVTDNSGATASDDVVITVNPATSTPPTGPAIRIQAESWIAMSGIGTEGTTDDGGGLNIGWIDNQDWMDYSVNLAQAGTYTVSFRVASPAASAQVQLRSSNGTVLATLGVPNTGWWQTWQTVTATVTLPAGQQTLRVVSIHPDAWNFNWFELAGSTAVSTRGLQEQTAVEEEGSAGIEAVEVFPNPVSDRFVLKVSSPLTGTMQVQVVDANGSVAKQFNLQKLSAGTSQSYLSAQGLAKGEYTLKVQIGQWTKTVKLVKL
jgi:hypothetical protein